MQIQNALDVAHRFFCWRDDKYQDRRQDQARGDDDNHGT
jgi:hypothetical protein